MSFRRTALGIVGALTLLSMFATGASAREITPYVYSGAFDGSSESTAPFGQLESVAFDTARQYLYSFEGSHNGIIRRYTPAGVPVGFSSQGGENSISTNTGNPFFARSNLFQVDNRSGSDGSFYLMVPEEPFNPAPPPLRGYDLTGQFKPGFPYAAPKSSCGGAVDPQGDIWLANPETTRLEEVSASGVPTGAKVATNFPPCAMTIDGEGNFYVIERTESNAVVKFDASGNFVYKLRGGDLGIGASFGSNGSHRAVAADPSNGNIFVLSGRYIYEYAKNSPEPVLVFARPDPSRSFSGLSEGNNATANHLTVNGLTHEIYVANNGSKIVTFKPLAPVTVPTVVTETPTPTPTTAVLRGSIDPDGITTTKCQFEWGTSVAAENEYGKIAPCSEGNAIAGSDPVAVSAPITGLTKGNAYHVRLVAENPNGFTEYGEDILFTAQAQPKITDEHVGKVNTDGATVLGSVDPQGGRTTVQVEYGTDASYGSLAPVEGLVLPSLVDPREVSIAISGLQPDTEYHYSVVARNDAGVVRSVDRVFRTFPRPATLVDPCPNALSRQQTGAALLLNCRAYELVSAAGPAGYSVASGLASGPQPFDASPEAQDRVLYAVDNGGIPGTGSPTNHGSDPYLATRGANGWSTRYVGIPATPSPSAAPFGSKPTGSDSALATFSFGDDDLCAPCFPDGSSGVPIRTPDGNLAQGMAGQLNPGPSAVADGLVVKPVSADGSHLVFGSTSAFEADGNSNGDVSIYSRDLSSGTTQVISKTPAGANLPCLQGAGSCHSPGNRDGIAELDLSRDGSRAIVAQKVAADGLGNNYWHLYMHLGDSPQTADLTPGTASGVLFDGMTENGDRVFFSTRDQILPADSDASMDIYEAEVDGGGAVTLRLVTVGDSGPSNSNSCLPDSNWNTVEGGPNCDAVAFAGGAGLAADEGTFYFLSPEQLDGAQGVLNQVNLYVVRPGDDPRFVALMDSSSGKPGPPPPSRPLVKSDLVGTPLQTPESLAVNQISGDLYVAERGSSTVSRFTSSGAPHNFTAGPGAGTNHITGETLGGKEEGQIAVDSHLGSPLEGDFYVTSNGATVSVFSDSGAKIGSIEGFGEACGVAVDQSNGVLYVGDYGNRVWRLQPTSGTAPVSKANYSVELMFATGGACQVAADSALNVYRNSYQSGPTRSYPLAGFAPEPGGPLQEGTLVAREAFGIYADPSNSDLYVNTGARVDRYSSEGKLLETVGRGVISGSSGVAVNGTTHHLYAVNGSRIVEFGYEPHAPEPINNPAVRHAVRSPGTRFWGDFQVTADGHFAGFPSAVGITGFDSFNYLEVYRYDAEGAALACVSCTPTNARPQADSVMAEHGLSVLEDGRVFFSTREPLVLRDTNENGDAYEWDDGLAQLISSGTNQFDSGLYSASADGRDVYFFTRERLAPEDTAGDQEKIYDAREGGGFFAIPPAPPCAASDECHGPGTDSPSPPSIGSLAASPKKNAKSKCVKAKKAGKKAAKHCPKGKKKKRGHHKKGKAAGKRRSR